MIHFKRRGNETCLAEPPVVEERRGHGDWEQPDEDDGPAGPPLYEVGLHGEHDPEESITGYTRQGEHTGH